MEQISLQTANERETTQFGQREPGGLHKLAAEGDLKQVRRLCRDEPHLLNERDDMGETALHKAARHGHANVFNILLSHDKQKVTCNKMNQNSLDIAVEQDNQEIAMMIAEHSRWKEFLHRSNKNESQLQRMVMTMPEVAHRFLDNCIVKSGNLLLGKNFVNYDFRFLQGMPDLDQDNPRFFLHSFQTMITFKRYDCLTHALSQAMLHWKWSKLGWWLFMVNILTYTLFLACVTVTVVLLDDRRYMRNPQWLYIPNIVIIVLSTMQLLKELFQMYEERLKYLTKLDNWLELFLYSISLAATLDSMLKHEEDAPAVELRTTAAAAVFVAWANFVLYMQQSSYFGAYVIMMKTIIKTLFKLVLLFLPFMFAFGVPFFLLFPAKQTPGFGKLDQATSSNGSSSSNLYLFDRIGFSLFTTFMMLLGEMKYPHTVYKYQPIKYPFLSYPIYIMFVLCMPIIIKNLLIGLSVGDIKNILQRAQMEHYIMKIQLLLELERMLPAWLLKKFYVAQWMDCPSRKRSWLQKLTGFSSKIDFNVSSSTNTSYPSKELTKLKETVIQLSQQVEKQDERLENVISLLMELKTQMSASKSSTAMPTDKV